MPRLLLAALLLASIGITSPTDAHASSTFDVVCIANESSVASHDCIVLLVEGDPDTPKALEITGLNPDGGTSSHGLYPDTRACTAASRTVLRALPDRDAMASSLTLRVACRS